MELDDLIELGDSDELIREIDRRCDQRNWAGVEAVTGRCRLAVERGKQLWGAAAYAEYRLVLEAPAEIAALWIDSPPSVISLGPFAEVIASTHRWAELAPHLEEGPSRGVTAYECVARGEDLSDDPSARAYVEAFELPVALQAWEPQYPLAVYKDKEARFAKPVVALSTPVRAATGDPDTIDEPDVINALQQLVDAWLTQSNGKARAVAVNGDARNALAAFSYSGEAHEISSADAMALMAWAGASGGAHGRRRGMSVGRARAWWAVAAIGDALDKWPLHPNHAGDIATTLQWFAFGNRDVDAWELGLIAVDPIDDVAFAIHAVDHASEASS